MRFAAVSFFVKTTVPTPLWAFPVSIGNQNNSAFQLPDHPSNVCRHPPRRNRPLSWSSASPPAMFESPNNVSITAATSAAAAAIPDAATLADSQTTKVPGTELPSLPTITNFTHNSLPSETSELDYDIINTNNNDNDDNVSDDENDDDDDDVPGLFGTHSGDGDYTPSQFSVQQHVMYFLGEMIDQQKNQLNVEIRIHIGMS